MTRITKTLILLLIVLVTNANAQEKREYTTDIFGYKVYKCNGYEEKFGKDIMGNYEYENNRREKASLEKDVFGGMTYSDSNGNEIKYGKIQWAELIRKWNNDEEGFFMNMVDKYMKSRKKQFREEEEEELPGHDIHMGNIDREEFRQDITGDWQYRNSEGQTASLHIDVMGDINYSDSDGNKAVISKKTMHSQRKFRHRNPEEIFRHLVKSILLDL
ncbi:hypothetical protein [Parabacteroides sp. FAFU027]|uniref:hypothetical protein n=1 Tax=Parabacteroides sp. FAFU027 TaxID=2922715 RepID=UPI001FAEA845|nr:hypothetical protein [Parabacteroides sp. FAFU027]